MDVLSDILSHLKLTGTLYFRTEFSGAWSVGVPAYARVARFHYVHRGRCTVKLSTNDQLVELGHGDLIIIMRGAAHVLASDENAARSPVQLERVVEESGFTGKGALVHGDAQGVHETQLVCGHFAFDDTVAHPLIDSLPDTIHIKHYGDAAGTWMENTLRVIGAEAGHDSLGGELIAMKLSEIVFAQALRAYLQSHGEARHVVAAFADKNIAKTLTAIHENPGHPWNIERLASVAAMSRTAFVSRFTQTMRSTPMGYVTYWRLQIARAALRDSTRTIIDIAESIGYNSEAAFGRVFKRQFNTSPVAYRREHRA